MRRILFLAVTVVIGVMLVSAPAAFAAPNPQGTGQPGAPNETCGQGNATSQPPGLTQPAFTDNAAQKYAGSPMTPSLNGNQQKAISQYDVACFQQTANHG